MTTTTTYHWVNTLTPALTPTTFTFTFVLTPPGKYTFTSKPPPPPPRPAPFKRRRPLWDVDGSPHPTKKKRRLRLGLVTSRLSRPYSSPASNIADRGVARVGSATWPLPRRPEKNELRKAAIMNSVRRRLSVLKAAQAKQSPPASAPQKRTHSQLVSALALRDIVAPMARTHEVPSPLPPSPLGLSNYDALDMEEEAGLGMDGEGEDFDADGNGCTGGYYSDFSVRRSPRPEGEDYDYLDELDGIPPLSLAEEPPPLPQLPALSIATAEVGQLNEKAMDVYMAGAAQGAGTYVLA
ncbi:hypothetical protein V496_04976 [Pseudogymnoascus sp. VKM F-4515 (FW-2607)]|nr:hypothetical protein V496_04976 [Pseudogymnoascus sp. VKM F-4515 (FW-2607)]KFY86682.1 hypothetical protein V498_07415 [Pseudogymnoascus sp. VKM F-4517 (FW-2822)]